MSNHVAAFDTMQQCLASPENFGLQYDDPKHINNCETMRARMRCLDSMYCEKNTQLYRNEVYEYERVCVLGVLETLEDFDRNCGSSLKKPGIHPRDVIILSIVLPIIALLIIGLSVWALKEKQMWCFAPQPMFQTMPQFDTAPQPFSVNLTTMTPPPYSTTMVPPVHNPPMVYPPASIPVPMPPQWYRDPYQG
jgi:hypothetical protein